MPVGPEMITLTLPWPVSANRYWRSFVPRGHSRAIVTLSDEAKAYKATVGKLVRAAGIVRPITGRVAVTVQLYPARPQDWARRARKDPMAWDDDVRCIDLDNANKVLLDSLKGLALDDDKWVRRLSAERMEPDGAARVVVIIEALSQAASPQAAGKGRVKGTPNKVTREVKSMVLQALDKAGVSHQQVKDAAALDRVGS